MTEEKDITTGRMTREIAARILEAGKMKRGGVEVYVFDDRLSALPPVKNEELVGQDFIIDRVCGEIDTQYGKALILEIGMRPQLPTFSWLVGVDSVQRQGSIVGDNLKRFMKRATVDGREPFPLWVHLDRVEPDSGNPYYCLRRPKVLQDALGESAPPPAADLDDLPF